MNLKKLSSVLLGSATVAAMVLTPATAASAQVAAVERDSVPCSSPKGKWANFSWGEGITTATIYFNNHCSHRLSVKIAFTRKGSVGDKSVKYRCMTVNAKTKGKKKFYAAVYKPDDVFRVSRCS
ncbi:hypothetical protein HD597_005374 [Nonomuraea thailandensis]|uniref:Uncharacterized protein n=1 Tax=Nonomuraea thailandensis TaxID=1188745 RepID=A0A9X2GIV8_9ACTN|nr:hypothetical protein [Nonomuraea thailandensis]MCP2358354.1 hypothetical protein [Nonomuraea thailandensis]